MKHREINSRLSIPLKWAVAMFLFTIVVFALMVIFLSSAMAEVKASYLYNLSNFNGPIPYNWANVYVDKQKNEIYIVDPTERNIRIFNENGMEVYRFGDDESLGTIIDITVDSDGNIFVLSLLKSAVILCNFRGELVSEIKIKNLPPEFSMFTPDRIIYQEGRLYLAATNSLRIVVTNTNGVFEKGYDLAPLLGVSDKKRDVNDISGFNVDREGNMLFTIPVLSSAFRLSPEGRIENFGQSGSGPGKFGIASGIAADDRGYIYISDKLRCVVMVFNNNLEFKAEFGYRGYQPGNLIVPDDIGIDNNGRIYVAQAGARGVSVFRISYN